MGAPFGDQEAVSGDAECGVMVEAAPPAPFIITKAELLFELLIIALDPPPQFCPVDQPIKGDILGQAGKPILGRLGFVLRPLDQQPLFGARFGQQVVAVPHGTSPWAEGPRPQPQPCEPCSEPVRAAFAPPDGLPPLLRQAESERPRPSPGQAWRRSAGAGRRAAATWAVARCPGHAAVVKAPRPVARPRCWGRSQRHSSCRGR